MAVVVCSGAARAQVAEPTVVLHEARLLDVASGKIVMPGEVLVVGDRIREVGTRVVRPDAKTEVIDLWDRTLAGVDRCACSPFCIPGRRTCRPCRRAS